MPIDPNIALGVRPMEQPNMLAQMGQMMALRQAQQENESNNALRDFYARGGDISNPEQRRQLMSQAPLLGQKIIGQQSEIAARDAGTAEKTIKMYRNQAGMINSPEEAARWLTSVYSNPLTRPYVESIAPLDTLLGAIPKDAAGLDRWRKGAIVEADKLYADANAELSSRTSIATNAATNAQSDVNSRRTDTRVREALTPLSGEKIVNGEKVPAYFGFSPYDNTMTEATLPTVTVGRPTTLPQPTNNYAPPNVNALTMPPAGAPTSPVARPATAAVPSAVAPSAAMPSAAAPTSVVPSGANAPAPVQFRPKPSPQAEKQAQDEIDRAKGKGEVANIIGGLASKYNELATTGGMTSTKKGIMENIGSYLANTALGQEAGKMTATQEQSLRNEIRAQSPVLLQGIKKATGMTAKEMDSNADVKRWMEAMGSTTFDVQSTLGILKSLNAQFGSGNEIPAAPARTGNIASDPAIQSLINKYSK